VIVAEQYRARNENEDTRQKKVYTEKKVTEDRIGRSDTRLVGGPVPTASGCREIRR
jgi:hypothetical protein